MNLDEAPEFADDGGAYTHVNCPHCHDSIAEWECQLLRAEPEPSDTADAHEPPVYAEGKPGE